MSNFIYFVGRASDGRESIDLAKEKVEVYRKRIDNIINKIPEFQKVLLEWNHMIIWFDYISLFIN